MRERFCEIFSQKLLSHSSEEFRRGTPLCSKKIVVSKYFRDKSEGRVSRLFLKIVGSRNTESFRRGTILCFRNSRVSNILCLRAENNDFPKKLFCVLVPKNIVGQPFCVFTKFLVSKKNHGEDEGRERLSRFSQKKLMSLSVETFYWYNL